MRRILSDGTMKYLSRKLLWWALLLGWGMGVLGCSRGGVGKMQDLGTLGGKNSSGKSINEAGQVVGNSHTAEGETHAFLWEAGQGMQDLGTLGGKDSTALSINNQGQVVGNSYTAEGNRHAFLWEAGQGMQNLGTLGEKNSKARSINEAGQVVGNSETAEGETHAFLWEAGQGMQNLGVLSALNINEAGQVIGQSGTGEGRFISRACLVEAGKGKQDLGALGGKKSKALSINDQGQVVGWAAINKAAPKVEGRGVEGAQVNHAFLWEAGQGMQDLGTLGGDFSSAKSINEACLVMGSSETAEGETHAFCVRIDHQRRN